MPGSRAVSSVDLASRTHHRLEVEEPEKYCSNISKKCCNILRMLAKNY
jgi:hypothetical protein